MRLIRRERLAAPALLLLAPVLFFHDVCLSGRTYLLRDLFNWFYPWRVFAAESIRRGDFPLWNPYSYAGTPFLANMQSGLLYPPNVVFWLADFPAALRVFLVLQFALAAWFMYLMLRAWDCRPGSALTGAIAYAYGGWMIVHIEFPNKLAAAAWLPLVVLGMTWWWKGARARGLILGTIATACCVTAGYPQTTFTVMLGAGVIWCGAVARSAVARRTRSIADAVLSLPAIAALGALLAALQILPFLETLSRSAAIERLHPEAALSLGMSPWHFLDLIWPHLFGLPGYGRYWGGSLFQYWLGHFYVGLITLALALIGLFSRRPGARACGALLALTTLFCLGDRTPVAPLCVRWLPGFGQFKWLSTTSILAAFALCWLAALGLDRLVDALEGHGKLPRLAEAAGIATAVVVAAAGLIAWLSPAAAGAVVSAVASRVALPAQLDLLAGNMRPAIDDAIRAGALAACAALAWGVARAGWVKCSVFAGAIPALVFLDLFGAAGGINYAGDPAIYRVEPPLVARLTARPDPLVRLYVPDKTLGRDRLMYGTEDPQEFRWAANIMLFNLNLPWRLFSASDGDPLWTARWKSLHERIEREGDDDARGRLLAVANVGVILKTRDDGFTDMTEVPAFLPRVYVAAAARRVPEGSALETMLAPEWRPDMEVLVEDDFVREPRSAPGAAVPYRVHEVAYTNNTVTIDVEASLPCYLVLADANAPGWRATVDGAGTAVFTANHLFRGIDLPAGRHTVRFVYRPASVRWGAAGSCAGAAGLILTAWLGRRKERARRATAATAV